MKSIGILWAQFGPYHFARVSALKQLAGTTRIHAMELANQTNYYAWNRGSSRMELTTLCPGGVAEQLSFRQVFRQARRVFSELKLEICFLPSYAPKESLAALMAAKSLGIRTVMMNESHAGTARAGGLASLVKRWLVSLFDAALVGGHPQKRYCIALGFPKERIFLGYDAVDNDFFSSRAENARNQKSALRQEYQLPEHYFLSLCRFLPKKNLTTLIQAYHKCLRSGERCVTHLVMVGAGEEEAALRALCATLGLPVYEKSAAALNNKAGMVDDSKPGVHFYGFRQIEENPIFYALADAFFLPSSYEEWGLVANEAMASSIPIVVSSKAGCAEDLLEQGEPNHAAFADSSDLALRLKQRGQTRQNGFVFDPTSVDELAETMMLLEHSPGLRRAMGAASRRIVEKFSCRNFAENALLAARMSMRSR